MATMSKIEKELTSAVDYKRAKGDEDQAYLTKLAQALAKLDDDDFENLSTPAQEWANAAILAIKKKKELPAIPADAAAKAEKEAPKKTDKAKAKEKAAAEEEDDDEDEDEDDAETDEGDDAEGDDSEEEDDEDEDDEPPAKTKAKAKEKEKPAAKSKEKEAPKKAEKKDKPKPPPAKPFEETVLYKIKKLLCKDPSMKTDDIQTELKKLGHDVSTVTASTIRSDFRNTVRVLQVLNVAAADIEL